MHREYAHKFAQALVDQEWAAAHEMLTPSFAKAVSEDNLRSTYQQMVEYGDGPADKTEVVTDMLDWPARIDSDIGWAYVSIYGSDFVEGIAVVITEHEGNPRIRYIEWGRP